MGVSRRIYFIPRYIGALKYYEKLFPAIRERGFEPMFLFFEDSGMIEYCHARSIPCDTRFIQRGVHIPFYSPLVHEAKLQTLLEAFLNEHPYALVTEPGVDQRTRSLFKRAKEYAVKRYALQWALHTDPRKPVKRSPYSRYLEIRRRYGSFLRTPFVAGYYLLLRALFWVADFFHGGDVYVHLHHYAEKLGTIDNTLREYFVWSGWRDDQIQVVGFADYSLINNEIRSLEEDAVRREALCRRYSLDERRKRILVISNPFYTGRNAVYLDEEGQRAYFRHIFDDIRSVYPEREADILFKVHPREDVAMYAEFTQHGIRVYGNESNLNELIALSSLYIAHPLTAANFIIRGSGKPAIFLNFTPLDYFDEGKELYKLRTIFKTHDAFREALADFKNGVLPLQYDTEGIDTNSLEKIVNFVTT